MRKEAFDQYMSALRAGQKYRREALGRGAYPYPLVLDEILDESAVAGYSDLGVVDIPAELVVGTRSAGRTAALAGNFMPLLPSDSEFAGKWIALCDAHLGPEGLRDPVRCYEYMGRFYVQEGHKRVSILKSYRAPTISGRVIRVIPRYSDDYSVQVYYAFMRFYELSGLYGVEFRRRRSYARLQAALGFEEDHVWTGDERRSFLAGFTHFRAAYAASRPPREDIPPASALLVWLQLYSFAEIKDLTLPELTRRISALWPDILAQEADAAIDLETEPSEREKSLLSRLLSVGRSEHIDIAFLYAYPPETSAWTRAHDEGRRYLERHMGDAVSVKIYTAPDHDYAAALQRAVEEGARLIFATTGSMIGACRRTAALHSEVKILNCALSQPYTGVRMYYSRIHEAKYIAGAIAGAMTDGDVIGYVANYPIFGTPASINAFALGARLTNPRARVRVGWSCLPGDPVRALTDSGVTVISNRDAASPRSSEYDLGTYRVQPDGSLAALAVPCWNWGPMYEKIVRSIFTGAWAELSASRAVNYWWGMDSGVIDVTLTDALPDGVRSLGWILKNGIADGSVHPFRTRITDRDGGLRNDGLQDLTPEEIMNMDWFCDNVEGDIPRFEELLPMSRETVRLLGLYRWSIPPEKEEEKQL